MVRLTLNKPYTLHARSIDRITGTPSDYKLNLKDPITCDAIAGLLAMSGSGTRERWRRRT